MSLEEKSTNIVLSLLDLVETSLNAVNAELLSSEIARLIASVSHASAVVKWFSKRIAEYQHDTRFREYLYNLQKISQEMSNILNHWGSRGKIRWSNDHVYTLYDIIMGL